MWIWWRTVSLLKVLNLLWKIKEIFNINLLNVVQVKSLLLKATKKTHYNIRLHIFFLDLYFHLTKLYSCFDIDICQNTLNRRQWCDDMFLCMSESSTCNVKRSKCFFTSKLKKLHEYSHFYMFFYLLKGIVWF